MVNYQLRVFSHDHGEGLDPRVFQVELSVNKNPFGGHAQVAHFGQEWQIVNVARIVAIYMSPALLAASKGGSTGVGLVCLAPALLALFPN
jgi:hypothetical protein